LIEFLTGIKKGAVGDRAEYCISKAEETLGFAVGRYFVNETFGGRSREEGTTIITGIIVLGTHASWELITWVYKILSKLSRHLFRMSAGWINPLLRLQLKRYVILSVHFH
jgi:hypothetical protein